MSEGDDRVDLDLYNRLAGNLRRMLESIGLKRVPRDALTLEKIHQRNGRAE